MQSRAWAITWRKWLLLVAFATTTGVYSLPAQTPQEIEVARAARQFRRQVYLNYHTDRGEFDRRRAAAARAEQAFRDAGGTAEDAERLSAWLLTAATASERGGVMPATPEFGVTARVAEVLPKPSTASSEPLGPSALATTPVDADADRVTTLDVLPAAPETPKEEEVAPTFVVEPAVPQVEPTEAEAPEVAVEPLIEFEEDVDAAAAPVDADEHVTEPAHDSPTSTNEPFSAEQEAEFAAPDSAPFESEATESPDDVEPIATEVVDAPAPTRTSGVNLAELGARISGHNFAARGALLDWGPGAQGDLDQLAQDVEQISALAERCGLLRTYFGLLTPAERRQVGEPEKLDRVFTALADAIAELRERAESSDLPAEERGAEVKRLNELSRRLAQAFAVYDAQAE